MPVCAVSVRYFPKNVSCRCGTIVIEAMAGHSLDGAVDLDYAPSGVTWRLTCPAGARRSRDGDHMQILRSAKKLKLTADSRVPAGLRPSSSGYGPRLPTCALQQVGSYLGYTGHQINVVVTAARDPERTSAVALSLNKRQPVFPCKRTH